MNTKTVYKLVRVVENKRVSFNSSGYPSNNNPLSIKYMPNAPTFAPAGQKLFAFNTEKAAKTYLVKTAGFSIGDFEIWEATGLNVTRPKLIGNGGVSVPAFWARRRKRKKQLKWEAQDAPAGTVFADAIIIERRIPLTPNTNGV